MKTTVFYEDLVFLGAKAPLGLAHVRQSESQTQKVYRSYYKTYTLSEIAIGS